MIILALRTASFTGVYIACTEIPVAGQNTFTAKMRADFSGDGNTTSYGILTVFQAIPRIFTMSLIWVITILCPQMP